MPIEEFELLPMALGWKYEYWAGTAHVTPGHRIVLASVAVSGRISKDGASIRPVRAGDERNLMQPFMEAFEDSFDFCDWSADAIEEGAAESIGKFFRGKQRSPSAASRVALDPDDGSIVAAALITAGPNNPFLHVLFVVPRWQRRGIATAIVSTAINALDAVGEKQLTSSYNLGNDASCNWHRGFGFIEEPDVSLAEYYLRHARHELWRREKIGDLTKEEHATLEAECSHLEERAVSLRKLEDKEGRPAVAPILRFLWTESQGRRLVCL